MGELTPFGSPAERVRAVATMTTVSAAGTVGLLFEQTRLLYMRVII
jgi:hypothetical protein